MRPSLKGYGETVASEGAGGPGDVEAVDAAGATVLGRYLLGVFLNNVEINAEVLRGVASSEHYRRGGDQAACATWTRGRTVPRQQLVEPGLRVDGVDPPVDTNRSPPCGSRWSCC